MYGICLTVHFPFSPSFYCPRNYDMMIVKIVLCLQSFVVRNFITIAPFILNYFSKLFYDAFRDVQRVVLGSHVAPETISHGLQGFCKINRIKSYQLYINYMLLYRQDVWSCWLPLINKSFVCLYVKLVSFPDSFQFPTNFWTPYFAFQ